MEAARHPPGGSERPSRHPRRARNPPYCRPVAPADNTPLTHGELPCPNCGYQRRGLELERPCPECGARGFDGEVIVSGLPGVEPESKRSGALFRFAHTLLMLSLFGAPVIFGRRASGPWSDIGMGVAFTLAGVALGYFAFGFFRRRRERVANLSLERYTLEFRRDVLVVRQKGIDRVVPYELITKFDTQVDLPQRRTRVWLLTQDKSLQSHMSRATMVLVGDLGKQRLVAAEMKARIIVKRL